jgi:hypothetical protein
MDEERRATGVDERALPWLWRIRRWRRRDWLFVSVPTDLAIIVMYLHVTSPPPAISLANYERITVGMREREVERIVRARAGGYGWFHNEGKRLSQECGIAERWSCWGSDYGILEVGYDTTGRVCCKRLEYEPYGNPVQSDLWPWWRRLFDRSVPSSHTKRRKGVRNLFSGILLA